LTRLADKVVFCFDGDRAGRAAAWRALEAMLPYAGGTVEIEFLVLPDGDDPDALVRRDGPDAFRVLLAGSQSLSDFLLQQLVRQVDLASVDGRARLTALGAPLLHRLPQGVYRELLETRLAELVGLPRERFAELLAPSRPAPKRADPPAATPRKSGLIRSALALALQFPDLAAAIARPPGLAEVRQPGAALLLQLLEICAGNPEITTAGLLERVRDDPEGRHLGRLVGQPCLEDRDSAGAVLGDTLVRIVDAYRRERLGSLLARRADLSPGEQQELRRLSQFH
jgi:DNA primase